MEAVGKIKGTLTNKIGPLPAIAWGVILGGAFIGYKYYKAAKAPAAPAPVVGVDPTLGGAVGDVGNADDFSDGYGNATGNFGGSIIPGSTTTTGYQEPAVQSNTDWGKRAVTLLIAEGYNPLDASTAVSSYLYTGMQLNSSQGAMLAIAIQKLGPPPDGVIAPPDVVDTTTPTPTPTPTPTTPKPNDPGGFGGGATTGHAHSSDGTSVMGP